MTQTFTMDVTFGNDTRTVTFEVWTENLAFAVRSPEFEIAIVTGSGNKVWPATLEARPSANGGWVIAKNYRRLNRNGYRPVGWFQQIREQYVSKHVSA